MGPVMQSVSSVQSVQSVPAQPTNQPMIQIPSYSPTADGSSPQLTPCVMSPQLPVIYPPVQLESPVPTPVGSTSNSPDATVLPQLEATNVSYGQYLDINVSYVPSSNP